MEELTCTVNREVTGIINSHQGEEEVKNLFLRGWDGGGWSAESSLGVKPSLPDQVRPDRTSE